MATRRQDHEAGPLLEQRRWYVGLRTDQQMQGGDPTVREESVRELLQELEPRRLDVRRGILFYYFTLRLWLF